jgi:hypothetical protein
MVESNQPIRDFINSKNYSQQAFNIIHNAKKKLCDDLYDAEIDYCKKSLDAANLKLEDVVALLHQNSSQFHKFNLNLIKNEKLLDVGQDFNPHEEHEDDSANETYAGHSLTYLFTFAITYLLLRDNRNYFLQYLKKMRQPKSNKYQKIVESIYDYAQQTPL